MATNNFGLRRTALDEAIASGNFEKVQLLLQTDARPTQCSLQIACSKGYLEIVQMLIAANKTTFDYNTALMQTITKGQIEIVHYLVNVLGAEVNFHEPPISSNITPLILAIQYKQPAIAHFLINSGADVEKTKTYFAMTDLGFAAFSGDIDKVTNLLDEHALEICDKEGCTPLMRAVQNGNPQLVKLFINAGAHVNAKQKNGNTALIDAVRMRSKALVDILLNQGNLETETMEWERYYTAREIALLNKDMAIVQAIDHFNANRKAKSVKKSQEQSKEFLRFDILEFFQKFYNRRVGCGVKPSNSSAGA